MFFSTLLTVAVAALSLPVALAQEKQVVAHFIVR